MNEQQRYALARLLDDQLRRAEAVDAANHGDPWASLMLREDVETMREMLHASPLRWWHRYPVRSLVRKGAVALAGVIAFSVPVYVQWLLVEAVRGLAP